MRERGNSLLVVFPLHFRSQRDGPRALIIIDSLLTRVRFVTETLERKEAAADDDCARPNESPSGHNDTQMGKKKKKKKDTTTY